jgi:hypothetical protein
MDFLTLAMRALDHPGRDMARRAATDGVWLGGEASIAPDCLEQMHDATRDADSADPCWRPI